MQIIIPEMVFMCSKSIQKGVTALEENSLLKVQEEPFLTTLDDPVSNPDPIKFSPGKSRNSWQLFTSHGLVLISILNKPGRTVREIGLELNLTDRAVALAIADLVSDGYLERKKVGRRTFYKVNENHSLKYPVSPYGLPEAPQLTVRALRAENLATHAKTTE